MQGCSTSEFPMLQLIVLFYQQVYGSLFAIGKNQSDDINSLYFRRHQFILLFDIRHFSDDFAGSVIHGENGFL